MVLDATRTTTTASRPSSTWQRVIVRSPPRATFAQCVVGGDGHAANGDAIDVDLALAQWRAYVDMLRSCVDQVVELPADERHPDCCFVEDTSVVVGEAVVVNQLGHLSRRGEVTGMREALRAVCGLRLVDMAALDQEAALDGGDVLYTGRHVLVGRSARTNDAGIAVLRKSFPDTPVVVIPVPPPLLHLKCLISAIDREHLVIAETYRDQLCKHLPVDADGECAYTIITVPDVISSNVLAIPARKTVLVQQGYPRSEAIIRQALAADNWHVVPLLMSENVKADGALTCLSVFVPSQFEA